MIYQWKSEARIKADPQQVGERIEMLERKGGGFVTPAAIVADARSQKSPLHECFEWNDAKAAEAHRLTQARYIVRHLVSKIEIVDREPVTVRAFVSVIPDAELGQEPDSKDSAYTGIEHAMKHPILRQQVVKQARLELGAWRKRYAELVELADVFNAIDVTLGDSLLPQSSGDTLDR